MNIRSVQHLHAVEYVALDGEFGGGSINIRARNAQGNPPHPQHRSGTPTNEEWRTEALVSAVDPAWTPLLALLCLFGGWDPAAVIEGRIDATGSPEHGVTLRRAVETGAAIDDREWSAFSALLHLRQWQLGRTADDGYFDLYFVAEADTDSYSLTENDSAVIGELASMTEDIKTAVQRVIEKLLPDSQAAARLDAVGIAAPQVTWEDETMPVYGGGAYHFRFVAL